MPPPLNIEFEVTPNATPPTNVHVLIGANGVGKSWLLRDFVAATGNSTNAAGSFQDKTTFSVTKSARVPFTNVIHISYSAFDREPLPPPGDKTDLIVHAVGLSDESGATLDDQFARSLEACSRGFRRKRWTNSFATLSAADGILAETALSNLMDPDGYDEAAARQIFKSMSSGHKIVLLTITRLVELVEERSLVLLDEPETHLHPPLLSALTRAVSDLVIDRNGVAIIATHSPVTLQEVPRSCVWMLQRSGDDLRAAKLHTETFGESVSRLTSEVFRLDVNQTGFNGLLKSLLEKHSNSATQVLAALDDQLGTEGRFVLSALEFRENEEHV